MLPYETRDSQAFGASLGLASTLFDAASFDKKRERILQDRHELRREDDRGILLAVAINAAAALISGHTPVACRAFHDIPQRGHTAAAG